MIPTLTAEGVVLRPLSPTDADALFVAHSNAQTHLYWSEPAHTSVAQTLASIESTLEKARGAWAITENGGEAMGRIALFGVRDGVGEVGIMLRPDASGRGIASKALALVDDYAFNTLHLHRLAADIDPENSASLSLFLRAGYQREGVLRGNWKTHLGIRDTVMLGKLRGD